MSRIHSLAEHVYTTCTEFNYTASASGTGVNFQGYTAGMVVVTGTTSGGASVAVTLQDSPDNATWTTVGTVGTIPASKTAYSLVCNLNVKNRQQYMRLVYVVTGSANASNSWFLSNAASAAVSQTNTLTYL